MEQKALAYIRKHHLLQTGDAVLAGVSGGADSVCLLYFLHKFQNLLGIRLFAVHVNHLLRGAEANEDEAFVERLCKLIKVPFASVSVSMQLKAREEGLSLEEAGRALRYEIFEQKANEWNCNKIAVAHQKDDQAETVLFQILRGSGLKGMAGMQPMRGKIIRPLLCVERAEIEQYLKERNISYRTDSTNLSNAYSRNKIRNQLLPLLKEQINTGSVRHLLQLSEMAGEADAYFERKTDSLFNAYADRQEDGMTLKDAAWQEEKIIVGYMLRRCVQEMTGSCKDIAYTHICDMYELGTAATGKQLSLPGKLCVRKEAGGLKFLNNQKAEKQEEPSLKIYKKQIKQNNHQLEIKKSGYLLTFKVRPHKKNEEFSKNIYTKCFDYDKIQDVFFLRTRKPGDFLVINQCGNRKKLKNYLIDKKVDKRKRDKLLVLADGAVIIWVIGYRISESYKVTDHTKTVLEVIVTEEK